MTELYILNLKDRLNNPVNDYLHLFTPERKDKILRYKHKSDQNRTVWAEILARHVIAIKTHQNIESIRIMRTSNGKPYISPEYNLEFSISHSGIYAALSIGNHANGVDVERLSRADHEIAEHFFTHEEKLILDSLNEEEFAKKFMCMWTLKESYAKCTGIDLMNVIKNVNCENIPGKNFFIDDYVIGVCCEDLPDEINEIKIPPALLIPAEENSRR
ncbi:MAG: 4'-phosphopantetheinyl transferase superfamily protein [Synergistaceae bacterium]|nr:4'-phosphopantetheinyl transferase superfamily protein [Synergistaceae bacterium]MBQ3694147.1 4'-phosphopantetheinyl transferase superfamily protein [Synergistaceae bacterium]MBQ6111889.1 4'-phosphopantetheinyl transferase superfamily protein [Synergistaceae bacterium]MBQ9629441.1 4'-phosphopantetheinyl transferase superfamily protein [Synergistaceae bacterium]MBR0069985.1 4'-phosphopantetheinyl transferase superfamily protein [Synergistaceae bacterium]